MCVDKRRNDEDQPINVGLLKTPVHRKSESALEKATETDSICNKTEDDQNRFLSMATPMALKDISNRAQRELAMLYSPCYEEESDDASAHENMDDKGIIRKQLF